MSNNKKGGPDSLQLRTGPRVKHGGYTYIRTGKLPKKRANVERYLTWLRRTYAEDVAGREADMTAGQTVLLNKLILLEGLCRCIEITMAEVAEGTGRITEMPTKYLSYVNAIVKVCGMLGIERKDFADGQLTPLEIAATYDKEKEKKGL